MRLVSPREAKVLIIGQDPYIRGEAHGLAFSSCRGLTPSLEVLFSELNRSGYTHTNPNLADWAEQGVLLLNTILTTEKGISLAHAEYGWQDFTSAVVTHLLSLGQPLVVMLWGGAARDFFAPLISKQDVTQENTLVLKACHPVAQNRGTGRFVGCNHFVEANSWLETHGKTPILW